VAPRNGVSSSLAICSADAPPIGRLSSAIGVGDGDAV
jgi:hypothetical protein